MAIRLRTNHSVCILFLTIGTYNPIASPEEWTHAGFSALLILATTQPPAAATLRMEPLPQQDKFADRCQWITRLDTGTAPIASSGLRPLRYPPSISPDFAFVVLFAYR